jgi:Zn-dependent protease with chaperone function
MKLLSSPIRPYAQLILCTGLLLCVQHVFASDTKAPNLAKATAEASKSPASDVANSPIGEEKPGKPGKYDVNRIGQRSVGHGLNLYSLQKERALGEAMAAQVDRGSKFIADPEIRDYIERLAQKIARYSDAEVPFTVKVIDSPDRRVFALPGGFLYVYKGLIVDLDSEAELAALMAHEIAHVAARHATRFATRQYGWNLLSIPLTFFAGPAYLATSQIGPLSLKKFSRHSEIEADLLGIEYQYAAGYDPQVFVEALEKLNSKEAEMGVRVAKALPVVNKVPLHTQIGHAFSSYPSTEDRIQKLQTAIPELLPNRSDYIIDTSEFQEVKAKLTWTDRPILRRHQPGDGPTQGPVLRRHQEEVEQTKVADTLPLVTKGRVFSYLPPLP